MPKRFILTFSLFAIILEVLCASTTLEQMQIAIPHRNLFHQLSHLF